MLGQTEENAAASLIEVQETISGYSTDQIVDCLFDGEHYKEVSDDWQPSEDLILDFFRKELLSRKKISDQNYEEN